MPSATVFDLFEASVGTLLLLVVGLLPVRRWIENHCRSSNRARHGLFEEHRGWRKCWCHVRPFLHRDNLRLRLSVREYHWVENHRCFVYGGRLLGMILSQKVGQHTVQHDWVVLLRLWIRDLVAKGYLSWLLDH